MRTVPPEGPVDPAADRTTLSVQWRGPAPVDESRAHRRGVLAAQLRAVLRHHPGVKVDWDTLSLSAQTVEVAVRTEQLARTVAELRADGLRPDVVVDRQIVT